MTCEIKQADAIEFLLSQPQGSIDLVFGSPPYQDARRYKEGGIDLGIAMDDEEWVQWMARIYHAAQWACKGLVAFVVSGRTRSYRYNAAPARLIARLHDEGFNLRNPPIFIRNGIFGSGGPDWWRSDYETIICTTRPGRLPWSDNTACSGPPKYKPGGAPRHRDATDARSIRAYKPPALVNRGNLLRCAVGGGHMGSKLASLNEAPFPQALADVFVQSFCAPGGLVCDPFLGSGATAVAAVKHGRNFIGCDIRQSQVDLSLRRLSDG